MKPNTIMRVPEHVHWRRVDAELVVLDLAGGEYYGLSEVAGTVFECLAAGRTPDEVVATLVAIYDIGPDQLAADVCRVVDDLAEKGLLVVSPHVPQP